MKDQLELLIQHCTGSIPVEFALSDYLTFITPIRTETAPGRQTNPPDASILVPASLTEGAFREYLDYALRFGKPPRLKAS